MESSINKSGNNIFDNNNNNINKTNFNKFISMDYKIINNVDLSNIINETEVEKSSEIASIINNTDLLKMSDDELLKMYDELKKEKKKTRRFTDILEFNSYMQIIKDEYIKRGHTIVESKDVDIIINQLSSDISSYKRDGNVKMVKQLEDEKKAYESLSDFIKKSDGLYTTIEEAIKDYSVDVNDKCYAKTHEIFVADNYDKEQLEGLYYLINKYPGLCDNPVIQLNASKYMCDRNVYYIQEELKKNQEDLKLRCIKYNDDGSIDYANCDALTLALLYLDSPDSPYSFLDDSNFTAKEAKIIESLVNDLSMRGNYYTAITVEQYEHYLELYDKNPTEAIKYYNSLDLSKVPNSDDKNLIFNSDKYGDSIEKILLKKYCDYEFPAEEYANNFGMSQYISQMLFDYENSVNIEFIQSDDFNKYVDNDLINEITSKEYKRDKNIDKDTLDYKKVAYYMTLDERKVYFYRKNKYGDENANAYLNFLKFELRERAGKERALDTLEKFKVKNALDKDGKPIYDFKGLDNQALLALIGIEDGVQTWGAGLINSIAADGEVSCFDYEKMYILQMLNGNVEDCTVYNYEKFNGFFKSLSYEFGTSVGNMLPTVAVGLIMQAASGGIPVWALTAVGAANQGLFALSIYGNNKEELLQSGKEHDAKLEFRAILGALSEVALERFLGSVPGISKLDDSANILCKMLKEGNEETVQVLVDSLFDTVVYCEEYSVDLEELIKSGMLGFVTGGVLNVPMSIVVGGTKVVFGSDVITNVYNITDGDIIDIAYSKALFASLAEYSKGNYTKAAEIMRELIKKNPGLYTKKVNEVCNNILNNNNSNNISTENNNINKVNDVSLTETISEEEIEVLQVEETNVQIKTVEELSELEIELPKLKETQPSNISTILEIDGIDNNIFTTSDINAICTFLESASLKQTIDFLSNLNDRQIDSLLANYSSFSNIGFSGFLKTTAGLYANGNKVAQYGYLSAFYNGFRDHGFRHALEVTKYAKKLVEDMDGISIDEVIVASLAHDFGMRGGMVAINEKMYKSILKQLNKKDIDSITKNATLNEIAPKKNNGKIEYAVMSIDELYSLLKIDDKQLFKDDMFTMNFARASHPLNSAMDIITYSNEIANVAGVDAEVIALLAMSHSKSTSGISSFADKTQWKECVNILKQAADYNNLSFDSERLLEMIDNDVAFNRLGLEAIGVRDGDAMSKVVVDEKGRTVMQDGSVAETIVKDVRGNDYNHSIDGMTIISKDNGIEKIEFERNEKGEEIGITIEAKRITDVISKANANEIKEVVGGFSQRIHAGELNCNFDSSITKTSVGLIYEARAFLENPNQIPWSTFEHGIVERIGEINTYTNCESRSFTLYLPAEAEGKVLGKFYEYKLNELINKELVPKWNLYCETSGISMDSEVYKRQIEFYENIKIEYIK